MIELFGINRYLIISLLLVFTASTGCGSCESLITDANHSPDGKYAVLITRTNCGATDPFDTQIILIEALPSRELGKHNIILFDVDERPSSFRVLVMWKGPKNLAVTCQGCQESDIEVKKSSWKDVTISYDIQPKAN